MREFDKRSHAECLQVPKRPIHPLFSWKNLNMTVKSPHPSELAFCQFWQCTDIESECRRPEDRRETSDGKFTMLSIVGAKGARSTNAKPLVSLHAGGCEPLGSPCFNHLHRLQASHHLHSSTPFCKPSRNYWGWSQPAGLCFDQ